MRLLKLVLLILVVSTLQSCIMHKASFKGKPFENYNTYGETNFDENKLNDLTEYINKNSATTGLVVLHKGK